MVKFQFKDFSCCCNKEHKKYTSFCIDCKKNLCILCNKTHKKHNVQKFSDLYKLSKEEKKELKNKIDEQKQKIEKIKIILDTWLKRTAIIIEKYKKKLELYWELNNIIFNRYDISKNYYEEIKNIENIRNDFDNQFLELLKSENDCKKQNDIILKILNNENQKQKLYEKSKKNENENIKIEMKTFHKINTLGNIENICELKKENFFVINARNNNEDIVYIFKKSENKIDDQIFIGSIIEGGKIMSLTELKNGNLLIVQKKCFKIIKILKEKKEIKIIQNRKLGNEEFIQIIELINGYLVSIIYIANEVNYRIELWDKNLMEDLYESKEKHLPNKKPIFLKEINKDSFLVYFYEGMSIYSSKKCQEIIQLTRINKPQIIKDIISINEDIIFIIYHDSIMIYNLLLNKNSNYYKLGFNVHFICKIPNSNNSFLTNYIKNNNFGLIPLIYDSFNQKINLGEQIKTNHEKEITNVKFLSSEELITVSLDKSLKFWKIKKKNI